MKSPWKLVLLAITVLTLSPLMFSSATNIYITQNGSPSGNCTTNAQSLAWFNNAANWGNGPSQIGPGTTVLLCGTFNIAPGAAGVTVQGSGTSANWITIQMDTNAVIQSTYLGGADLFTNGCSPASSCPAGIEVFQQNYIILDGGSNGIIQNTANGTNLANHQPSVGIYGQGDHIIVRNFTIQNIYQNAGSNPSATDTNGSGTAGIRFDNNSTNIAIYNNTVNSSREGISTATGSTTGPNSCPTPIGAVGVTTNPPAPTGNYGICIYNNTLSDHAWQILANGSGTVNIFSNEEGDNTVSNGGTLSGWLNWQYPTSAYHQDGIFAWGTTAGQNVTYYVYDNYSHGDLGQGSPSGHLYCTSNGVGGSGTSSCNLVAFNNVFVQTGSTQWPKDGENDQLVAVNLSNVSTVQSVALYNNTFVGGAFALEIYTSGGAPQGNPATFTWRNNIWQPGVSGTGSGWYDNSSNGGTVMSSVSASNNLYYNGDATGGAWQYNSAAYSSLSSWQNACGCDPTPSQVANPQLNSNYTIPSSSPAIGLGANLSSVGITALNYDYAGIQRPASGAWDAGAFQGSGGGNQAPAAPTGLTASVN